MVRSVLALSLLLLVSFLLSWRMGTNVVFPEYPLHANLVGTTNLLGEMFRPEVIVTAPLTAGLVLVLGSWTGELGTAFALASLLAGLAALMVCFLLLNHFAGRVAAFWSCLFLLLLPQFLHLLASTLPELASLFFLLAGIALISRALTAPPGYGLWWVAASGLVWGLILGTGVSWWPLVLLFLIGLTIWRWDWQWFVIGFYGVIAGVLLWLVPWLVLSGGPTEVWAQSMALWQVDPAMSALGVGSFEELLPPIRTTLLYAGSLAGICLLLAIPLRVSSVQPVTQANRAWPLVWLWPLAIGLLFLLQGFVQIPASPIWWVLALIFPFAWSMAEMARRWQTGPSLLVWQALLGVALIPLAIHSLGSLHDRNALLHQTVEARQLQPTTPLPRPVLLLGDLPEIRSSSLGEDDLLRLPWPSPLGDTPPSFDFLASGTPRTVVSSRRLPGSPPTRIVGKTGGLGQPPRISIYNLAEPGMFFLNGAWDAEPGGFWISDYASSLLSGNGRDSGPLRIQLASHYDRARILELWHEDTIFWQGLVEPRTTLLEIQLPEVLTTGSKIVWRTPDGGVRPADISENPDPRKLAFFVSFVGFSPTKVALPARIATRQSHGGLNYFLLDGWSQPEEWGLWSASLENRISFWLDSDVLETEEMKRTGLLEVGLEGRFYLSPARPELAFSVSTANLLLVEGMAESSSPPKEISVHVPVSEIHPDGRIDLFLRFSSLQSPLEMSDGTDARLLGFAWEGFRLRLPSPR